MSKKIGLNTRGFTLIELIVVLVVISLIGGVVLSIFFSVLRGSNKTNNLIVLRQNGQYAMDQVSRMVREAKSVDYPDCSANLGNQDHILITGNDGNQTSYECRQNGNIYTLASNSANFATIIDNSTVNLTSCSFSCSQNPDTLIPVVTFDFTLAPKGSTGTAETSGSLPFETAITLRNYGQ